MRAADFESENAITYGHFLIGCLGWAAGWSEHARGLQRGNWSQGASIDRESPEAMIFANKWQVLPAFDCATQCNKQSGEGDHRHVQYNFKRWCLCCRSVAYYYEDYPSDFGKSEACLVSNGPVNRRFWQFGNVKGR
jgi:hypothetical protein